MSLYFYFSASLPMLEFRTPSTLSLEKYLEDAQRLLPQKDFNAIEQALEPDPQVSRRSVYPLVREWGQLNHRMCNQGAYVRAASAKKDPASFVRGKYEVDSALVDLFHQADKADNLLQGELLVDEYRWKILDELEQGHFFDLENLIIYALRLQILERQEKMTSVKGKQKLEEYLTAVSRLR